MSLIQKIAAPLALIFFTSLAVLPATVSAGPFDGSKGQACQGAKLGGNSKCGGAAGTLSNRVKSVVNIISAIVAMIAVIMIVIGGFRYVTSGGDSNSISGAKNTIIYAIAGLIIVGLAQAIVRFVLSEF